MSGSLTLLRSGPGVTVQDLGRAGYIAQGLSRGGAADPFAIAAGAALLGQSVELAALEIAGAVVEVETKSSLWVALTGAPMQAKVGDGTLAWNASHMLQPGDRLRLGPHLAGTYAYLHVAGGIDTPVRVGGRGAHLAAGLGAAESAGAKLPAGPDPRADRVSSTISETGRFDGGRIRFIRGPQTALFADDSLRRFLETPFRRTAWGNRQGVKLGFEGQGFGPADGLQLVSEMIVPGDIQVTGDGTPYVLGPECQTTGGYPRIGTIVPQDLPLVLQAGVGAPLEFELVERDDALADYRPPDLVVRDLRRRVKPMLRHPSDVPDLLAHTLVSGVTAGRELSEEGDHEGEEPV